MFKKLFFILLLLMCLLVLGCNNKNNTNEEYYYRFIDDNNNEITLLEKPKNVACLFSSFTEIWNLSGGNTKISVYESLERGFVDNNCILVDAGAGKSINNEVLIYNNPDFVICSCDITNQVKTAEILKDTGINVACFKIETFNDYLRVLKIFTDINDRADLYKEYGTDVKDKINNLLSNINKKEDVDALFIRSGSTSSSAKAKRGDDHFAAYMLGELGVNNIADECKILLDGISNEEVLVKNPDYIFVSLMGNEEAAIENMNNIFSGPIYSKLDAVKYTKYYYLPKDLFQFKPNHRWYEAYEYLVDILYGDENE